MREPSLISTRASNFLKPLFFLLFEIRADFLARSWSSRTLIRLYKTIQGWSSRLLHRAETAIVEVSPSGQEIKLERAAGDASVQAGRIGQRVVWDPPGGWVDEE